MIRSTWNKKIFYIVFLSVFFNFCPWMSDLMADDHNLRQADHKRYDKKTHRFEHDHMRGSEVRRDDEGNEISGLTTAWLLVSANLTIALSILLKAMARYLPLDPQKKRKMKELNRLQKRHLMRFHYVLNPVAMVVACFHFLLSSCRSSSMPEWGLIMVVVMIFLGIILKFKVFPKGTGKIVYRLHTNPAFIMIIVLLLVTGHQLVD